MPILIAILQTAAIFGVPLILIRYRNAKIIKPIGTVGAAYILGLAIALLIFLLNKAGAGVSLNSDIGEIGSYVAIGIAIPLLLFNSDLKQVRKLSKTVLVSFVILIVSATVVTTVVYFAYGKTLENGGVLSAMAAGLYTGGTPNLNAIGNIFHLDSTSIGIANLSDMLIGGIFYVFLLLAAKPLLRRFLKKPNKDTVYMQENALQADGVSADINYTAQVDKISAVQGDTLQLNDGTAVQGGAVQIESAEVQLSTLQSDGKAVQDNAQEEPAKPSKNTKKIFINFLIALGMAAGGGAIGVLIWLLTGAQDGRLTDYLVPSVMVSATVLGIIGSFNKKISSVKESSSLGQYFILVFSFALSMSVRIDQLGSHFLSILLLYGAITLGTFIIHILLSKLVKTDVDCALVTLTAGIYGPAFIPALTGQLKNDSLTVPGLICGSVGYAIGTFLGIGLGALFLL
jgi:uncharacterized membrane protein